MRNREDECLLGLIISHCDDPAAPLQEMTCFEVPAQFPVEEVLEPLALLFQLFCTCIILLSCAVEVGFLRGQFDGNVDVA